MRPRCPKQTITHLSIRQLDNTTVATSALHTLPKASRSSCRSYLDRNRDLRGGHLLSRHSASYFHGADLCERPEGQLGKAECSRRLRKAPGNGFIHLSTPHTCSPMPKHVLRWFPNFGVGATIPNQPECCLHQPLVWQGHPSYVRL